MAVEEPPGIQLDSREPAPCGDRLAWGGAVHVISGLAAGGKDLILSYLLSAPPTPACLRANFL